MTTCNSLSQKKDDLEKIEVEKLKMSQYDVKNLQDQLSALNLKIDDTKILLDHAIVSCSTNIFSELMISIVEL